MAACTIESIVCWFLVELDASGICGWCICLDHDKRGYGVTVRIGAKPHLFKLAVQGEASFAVLHLFNFHRGEQIARASDCSLNLNPTRQACVPAQAASVPAGMMNNADVTVERLAQLIGGSEIGPHIGVIAFATRDRAVESVEADLDGVDSAELVSNGRDKIVDLFHEHEAHRLQIEGQGRRGRMVGSDDAKLRRAC